MKLIITCNTEAKDLLLDLGVPFKQTKGMLVTTIPMDDDDELLIDSLAPDELAEFFGIDSEFVIATEIK